MDAANAVPVIGTPLAYGIGFIVLLLIVFTESWGGSLTTVAHEGAHMVLAVLTFRGHSGFTLKDGGGAATKIDDARWGVGDYLITFAGYAAPPLLGLGGAHLVRSGNTGGVLVIALILGIAAFFQARNQLAYVVTLLIVIGTGWTLFAAGALTKAGVGVALVWWLLIGGLVDTFLLSRAEGSDPYWLARRTLVPRIVWQGVWIVIAVVCAWKGGRLLLGR